MRAFTRYETAVVASLGVAGLGVALTAALADNLNIPAPAEKEEAATGELDVEIKLPSLPNSKEQFLQSWAEGYVHNKNILSKGFRFAGQMMAAPIAVLVIDSLYGAYCEKFGKGSYLKATNA